MEADADENFEDADFAAQTELPGPVPGSSAFRPIVPVGSAVVAVQDYWTLIRNPCVVLNDLLYRFLTGLPGHPVMWALLLGFGLLLPSALFDGSVERISHVRTYTEVHASYFFLPVIFVQVTVMPVFYRAVLRCFDSLRYTMNASDTVLDEMRHNLINPGKSAQLRTLGAILLVCIICEEYSSSRLSRFATGDWDGYDIWFFVANVTALATFLWYLVMPIGRTFLLSRYLGESISPRLFDDGLGEPVATFGLRAGLLFAIPYFFVGSFAPLVMSDSWTYVLPGLIGSLTAVGFSIIPAVPLRRVKRRLKREEVEKVNFAVARLNVAVPREDLPVSYLSELATLLEYGREVKALREWPFEARMIRGFGLYFLLVPMTWVGSALVEIVVEHLAS